MKKKRLNSSIALVMMQLTIMSSYGASTSMNTPTTSCKSVIAACDSALAAKNAQIKARDEELSTAGMLIKAQADALQEKDKALTAWYRSPWLYLGLGLAGGLYLGRK